MSKQWIVVADSQRARIFQTDGSLDELVEVDDLFNPEGRMDEADLRHDAKGRFYGKGNRHQGHTAEPHISRERHDRDEFSRQVMQQIEKGCDAQRFETLVMVAPAEFLGLLRQHLSQQLGQRVVRELHSDIAGRTPREICAYLKTQLRVLH